MLGSGGGMQHKGSDTVGFADEAVAAWGPNRAPPGAGGPAGFTHEIGAAAQAAYKDAFSLVDA
jgi:hypothetical protein